MTKPSYDDAVSAIHELIDAENGIVSNLGGTRLLTHGQPVEHAIVLLHGFTNCPQQFAALGEQFHRRGYNVLIPRLPHHGLADRMTRDLVHRQTSSSVMNEPNCPNSGCSAKPIALKVGWRCTSALDGTRAAQVCRRDG